ncbi:hypothetical protein EVAR_66315_1 [Eumeta japonica]|uniref:Uncharacterized protein n=1 Tax=Eumeta variegata TaxID=151549 RepID=A0A4C1ZT37_EUMVA|nr:hypothetical protein EVAR_66315_1 [Eumeta japonica]
MEINYVEKPQSTPPSGGVYFSTKVMPHSSMGEDFGRSLIVSAVLLYESQRQTEREKEREREREGQSHNLYRVHAEVSVTRRDVAARAMRGVSRARACTQETMTDGGKIRFGSVNTAESMPGRKLD